MIRIQSGHRALFASDVHLGAHAPRTARHFLAMLETTCAAATHLFLLGDLFEAWIGDDQPDPVALETIEALARISTSGVDVRVMRGNRDFLLDAPLPGATGVTTDEETGAPAGAGRFSTRAGVSMIDDPCTIDLFGTVTLLAHGDAFCTDDAEYQRFRNLTRSPAWQQAFLQRGVDERQAIGKDLRARSELSKAGKAEDLMDVNEGAVREALRASGASLLIHGHTHRPATHRVDLHPGAAQRWVLPDWDADDERGGLLLATESGLERVGSWKPAF
jgi:UDP-2,3-diacylglucosamine hydrolase